MNQLLIAKYKEEEIIEALNNIGPTKASGPDGFPAIFFQKFWHIVGREVTNFCLEILNKCKSVKHSYTWKSIWAAKGLLLSGLYWRVGTGRDIRIEDDGWVPNVEGLGLVKQ